MEFPAARVFDYCIRPGVCVKDVGMYAVPRKG